MNFSVYADLSRRLTEDERAILCEALERTVPDGGCVGRQKGPTDEIYFCIEAYSEQAARDLATRYMGMIIERAGVELGYVLELTRAGPP